VSRHTRTVTSPECNGKMGFKPAAMARGSGQWSELLKKKQKRKKGKRKEGRNDKEKEREKERKGEKGGEKEGLRRSPVKLPVVDAVFVSLFAARRRL
jgi:hypothetical protein